MSNNQALPILVAEDSDEDFDMLMMTFKRFGITNEVCRCQQGEEVIPALKILQDRDARFPGLILLDLNLIGIDGREVLKQVKSTPRYKRIPVIVLSTSSSMKDVDVCYEAGANSYSIKPVDLEKFESFVQLLKSYWLEHCVLPQPLAAETIRKHRV